MKSSLLWLLPSLLLTGTLSLLWELPADDLELRSFIFWQLRVPRTLLGFFTGSTLALVGACFQTLFQNPLATPSTVGTTAGATLGALLALFLGGSSVWFFPAVTFFAFLGALLASLLVLGVAWRNTTRMEEILLAGIAISLATGAISQALHALSDAPTLFASAQWSLGQLPQVGYERVLSALLPCSLCALFLFFRSRALAVLALGEEWAHSMGVPSRRVRLEVLTASAIGVGAVVALVGPIAFVGLLVPHLMRRLFAPSLRALLPLSWLAGGIYLLLCDLFARTLFAPRELPVGVLTAALGAPTLFFLVFKKKSPA